MFEDHLWLVRIPSAVANEIHPNVFHQCVCYVVSMCLSRALMATGKQSVPRCLACGSWPGFIRIRPVPCDGDDTLVSMHMRPWSSERPRTGPIVVRHFGWSFWFVQGNSFYHGTFDRSWSVKLFAMRCSASFMSIACWY